MSKLVLNVIHGEKADVVPIWIMRQAGRYLPQYRKIREKYDFLSLCLTPELAAEVTLQPVEILDVDAAIIFSDIAQIFDTWGGILSPPDFQCFSWPYLKKLISEFRGEHEQPLIYFMRGSGGLLHILKDLPVEVMGIDWTINLSDASQGLENRFVLQGNLDPAVLLSSKKVIKEKTLEILQQGKELKGHIFNLGHGVLPEAPVENVRFLVNLVHRFSPK